MAVPATRMRITVSTKLDWLGRRQTHSSSKPSANDTAAPVSFILCAVNRAMRSPMLIFGTVWRLSKFAAHVLGHPSSFVKTTSVGILRIVEVMGATVAGGTCGRRNAPTCLCQRMS